MPLRAIVNGNEMLSFDYDPESWDALKKIKDKDIRLPCCGERGACRTSKLGTQHFYHLRRGECDSEGESAEHLRSKQTIVEAARAVGWTAMTEVPGSGWRADVLCTKGTAQVAFEVQWSRQTYARTLERTALYEASRVRVCWLFKRMPDDLEWRPSKEVPAFVLPTETDGLFSLVSDLLSGKWRFMQTECYTRKTTYTGVFLLGKCESCGGVFEYLAACASSEYVGFFFGKLNSDFPEYVPQELHTFYLSHHLNRQPVAQIQPNLGDSNHTCPHCGISVWYQALHRQRKDHPWYRLYMVVDEVVSSYHPHWCSDPTCTQHPDKMSVTAARKHFKTKFKEWPPIQQVAE